MLITFEGIDGSGKSTQIALLEARLLSRGRKVLRLREPGGTEVSERIRAILLDRSLAISPVAELLLFSAARAQIVNERVRPALDDGVTVLLDRFYDSTTAYQGAGRGVATAAWIESLHELATEGVVPDRTIWIDIPLDLARRRQEGLELDRIEDAERDFFERIHEGYAALAKRHPERFLRVDGTLAANDLHQVIWDDISRIDPA